jgi:DNA mismatch repair ATPase MutS
VGWLEARQNQIFVIVAFALMWTAHFGLAIERWRARHGPDVRRWLSALAEIEALCALAGYAYEHPDDPFPELSEEEPALVGEDLGHPLLSPEANVRNSIELGHPLRVIIVSGSNMSGKSTLLRTVGVNVVLALAGAPVRARRMRLSRLQVGATLRVQDSLQQGASRFYAEIRRLRQVMDLARGTPPLLFLLDEILHGTNSHDRKIGGEQIVRALADANAIGLVTTHDLALAGIADALGERACNVHFADEIVDGELRFDYRMKPGIVRKSNALELMRSVGLDV